MNINSEEQLNKQIENSIKARGLYESMQIWDVSLVNRTKRYRYVVPIVTTFAVALILLVLFIPITTSTTQHVNSLINLEDWTIYRDLRGGDTAASFLDEGSQLMHSGKYADAYYSFEKAEDVLHSQSQLNIQQQEMLDDAQWYCVLSDLSRGQFFYTMRGKIHLYSIAETEGIHQAEAQQLLSQLR